MDNKTLINGLVEAGILKEDSGKRILEEAAFTRRRAEEIIYEKRLVEEIVLAKAKAKLLGIPYKKVNLDDLNEGLLKVIPEETVKNYKTVPLSRTQDMLVAGMVYPDDEKAQEALKFIAKQLHVNIGVYLITPSDWEAVLRRYSPYQSEVQMAVKSLNLKPGTGLSSSQRVIQLEEGVAVSEEAPIIKIIASTLKEAVYEKASDIHIEPQRSRVRVRFRVDGELKEVSSFPLELHQPMISRVKVLSSLKIDETRMPQDGRFRTTLLGRDIDFRVATFPTPVGEKVAIRVLDPNVGLKGLEELGLTGKSADIIREGIAKPYGMVLISGPTGSGKTTTLYAVMQVLNKDDVNIVSLEDPVEYFIDGLNQSQVHPEIGYDFASGLRQILRQDPDIIMIGEIRDNETASLSIHAALTGHIVLSTIHTNNALGVIPRLIDMKVDPFLLPPSLNLMLAQRLVGRLCEKCKKTEQAPSDMAEVIKKGIAKLPKGIVEDSKFKINRDGPYEIYHAPGCPACKGKGINGRVALFEVLKMTPELENIINSAPTEQKILEEGRRQGMVTLREDGILKALGGQVLMEEVLRETTEV